MRRSAPWLVLVLALLALGGVYSLRPAVQRNWLLAHAPADAGLAVEQVRVLPWSLSARGLEFSAAGVRYRIGKLEARFNPFGLLTDTLIIHALEVKHTTVDARGLKESVPGAPFAGVLATLNQGLGLQLDAFDLAVDARLPDASTLELRARGGGLKPHLQGELPFDLLWLPRAGADPAREGVALAGRIGIHQLRQGRMRQVSLVAGGRAFTTAARAPERFDLELQVAPPPGLAWRGTTRVDGKLVSLPAPEALHARLFLVGDSGETRAELTATGLYRGDLGLLSATWQLDGNEALLAPYLEDAEGMPELALKLTGAAQWSLSDHRGILTIGQRATFPLPGAAPALGLVGRARASFTAETLTLEEFNARLGPADGSGSLLDASLRKPLVLPFSDPWQILAAPGPIAEVAFGPFDLSALSAALPGGFAGGGTLSGQALLEVEAPQKLALTAITPLRVAGLRLARADETWVADGTLSLSPQWHWSRQSSSLALRDLVFEEGGQATLSLSATARRKALDAAPWRVRAAGTVGLERVAAVPMLAARVPAAAIPEGGELAFELLLTQGEQAVLERLALGLGTAERPQAISLSTRRALSLAHWRQALTAAETRLPPGELIQFGIRALPLAWFNPWLSGYRFEGRVLDATFTLLAEEAGGLVLRPDSSLETTGVALYEGTRRQLQDLALRVRPRLRRSGENWSLDLAGLRLAAGPRVLAAGHLGVSWNLPAEGPVSYRVATETEFDFAHWRQQPLVGSALPESWPALGLTGQVACELSGSEGAFEVHSGTARLKLEPAAHLALRVTPGLQVRTRLAPGENLARHVVGTVELDVADLPSTTLSEFLALGQVSFKEVSARLNLHSDGALLRVGSAAPLRLEAVRLRENQRALTEPFELVTEASLVASRRAVKVNLDPLTLQFPNRPAPALAGSVHAELHPGARVPLIGLESDLRLDLPQWLAQGMALPGHRLTGGQASLQATVKADRSLTGRAAITGLQARQPLAITDLELPFQGSLAADGRGFDFRAPVQASGASGPTRAVLMGHYAPQPDEPRVITLGLESEVFQLNDLLAAWAEIRPAAGAGGTPRAARRRSSRSRVPDDKAAWKVIAPALVIEIAVDKLFYSDYLAFDAVHGKLDLRHRRFGLQSVAARFHESEIAFDSVMRFKAGAADPYSLEMKGRVRDFDLNTFFMELVPGEKPRVEGLFGVDFSASGAFPNFSQLRNRLLFDVRLKSRDGLFRPLPPGSPLLLGASDVLGAVGEGLSYLPTGGFGAGAVARLVNYIAEIDYDTLDLHLVRDSADGVRLEEFQLVSPTIVLSASGGIRHAPGADILDSPLDLKAELDMLGRGAAILYSLDLMRDEKTALGYWRGPEFRIWGSLAAPESNFDEIVNLAGSAATTGAFTRPLSGLIGNLKFRWFDDDSAARERAREARRARDAREEGSAAGVP